MISETNFCFWLSHIPYTLTNIRCLIEMPAKQVCLSYTDNILSANEMTRRKKVHNPTQGNNKCKDHGNRINWSLLYTTCFLNESLNIVWANSKVPDLTAQMCSLIRVLVIRTMQFSTILLPILKFDFLNMPIWYDLSYNELSTEVISSPNSYWERSERRKILLWNGD